MWTGSAFSKGEEDPDPARAEQCKRWRELHKLQPSELAAGRAATSDMEYDKPQVELLGNTVTLVQAVKVRRIDPRQVAGAIP